MFLRTIFEKTIFVFFKKKNCSCYIDLIFYFYLSEYGKQMCFPYFLCSPYFLKKKTVFKNINQTSPKFSIFNLVLILIFTFGMFD